MRLSRRGIIVALVVALAGAGVVYGSVRFLARETVLYLEPDNPGPDPFTDPALFTEDILPTTTTTLPTTTTLAASPSPGATASPSPAATASPSPGAAASPTASPGATPSPGTSPDPFATTTIPTFVEPPQPVARRGECDVETLIEYLNADEDMTDAWLEVLGIDFSQFEEYVRTLTPTVLSRDVRVTAYSYTDGEAQEYQAILTEGNAVLIDSVGELVVRCYSGSPLAPPRQIRYQCDGCPENYSPPPPCEQTCYPEPTTTTTTTAPPTTTTTVVASTTTTRRSTASTTRAAGAGATTTRPGATATTRPGGTGATTAPGTPTTTAPPTTTTAPEGTTTSTICILPGLCLN